jgi:hypothetical protein
MTRAPDQPQDTARDERDADADELTEMLDRWRQRLGEIQVEIDFAQIDFLRRAAQELDPARKSDRAAASKLRAANRDALAAAETLLVNVRNLLHDTQELLDDIENATSSD